MIEVQKTQTGVIGLTLEEVKDFMRVDFSEDDALITSLINQSKDLIEEYLNRSLVVNTIHLIASPREELEIPFGPIETIESVKDVESGDDIDYEYDGLLLTLKVDKTFSVSCTSHDNLPAGLKLGWLEIITWLYENRGDTSGFGMMLYYNNNLMPYRRKVWI